MSARTRFGALVLVMALPPVAADHDQGCVPTSADPATVNAILLPDGTLIYVEERGVPAPFNALPVPGSGFLIGDGTRSYQESNDIEGLQRGATDLCWFFPPDPVPCQGEPVNDENCGHGPDTIRFA